MKKLKSSIYYVTFIAVLYCTQQFFVEPFIEKRYLYLDALEHSDEYWKFLLPAFLLIYFSSLVYTRLISYKEQGITKNVFFVSLLYSLLITFFFNFYLKDLALILNTKFNTKKIERIYEIQFYNTGDVRGIYDKEELIYFKSELNKIDSLRKKNNLISLFELNEKDTIHINWKKGFLNIKYLE